MASSKRIFAPRMFAGRVFAPGVLRGIGSGEAVDIVLGPYRTVAWQFFIPGSNYGQSHSPGGKAWQSRSPQSNEGQFA